MIEWKYIFVIFQSLVLVVALILKVKVRDKLESITYDVATLAIMFYIAHGLDNVYQSFALFFLYNLAYFYALFRGAKYHNDYIKPS